MLKTTLSLAVLTLVVAGILTGFPKPAAAPTVPKDKTDT
jgi:hypothetical protein